MKFFNNALLFPQCQGEYRKSQLLFILDGILINAAATITSGVFLSGYMVSLGAGDLLVGILNNSGSWSLIISLFSFLIFEQMQRRKKLLITLNIIARTLICTIVFIPFIIKDSRVLLYITTFMVIAGNLIWSVYSIGIMVWMISLLPNKIKNNYIYLRMFCLRVSFTLFSLFMGLVLDWYNKSHTGFVVVFSVGLILSLADAITLMNTHEPPNHVEKTQAKFRIDIFMEPLKNKEYRKFLVFIFLFYFSLTLSSSYTPLYQIKYLGLNYSFISFIYVITYANMIIFTHIWGRIETTKGLHFVLSMTALFIASEFFVYGFITKNTLFLLFISPFLSGIGNSGFNVSTVTYRYNLIPERHKTIYEGWYGAVFGLSALLGPAAGKLVMEQLPVVQNSVFLNSSFQFMYLISFFLAVSVTCLMFYRRVPVSNAVEACKMPDA